LTQGYEPWRCSWQGCFNRAPKNYRSGAGLTRQEGLVIIFDAKAGARNGFAFFVHISISVIDFQG